MGSSQPLSAGGHGELSSQSFLSSWKHCPMEGKALSLPTSVPPFHPQETTSGYYDGSILMYTGSYSQSEWCLCLLSPSPGHPRPSWVFRQPGTCPSLSHRIKLWFHFCGCHKIPWVYWLTDPGHRPSWRDAKQELRAGIWRQPACRSMEHYLRPRNSL